MKQTKLSKTVDGKQFLEVWEEENPKKKRHYRAEDYYVTNDLSADGHPPKKCWLGKKKYPVSDERPGLVVFDLDGRKLGHICPVCRDMM